MLVENAFDKKTIFLYYQLIRKQIKISDVTSLKPILLFFKCDRFSEHSILIFK